MRGAGAGGDPGISIHAPVKGATDPDFHQSRRFVISIHAPVKGATTETSRPSSSRRDFNPRTREGCDSGGCFCSLPGSDFNPRTREGCDPRRASGGRPRPISIHAPVKGATHALQYIYSVVDNFNPRTREGCDVYRASRARDNIYFNPRTREGCDTISRKMRPGGSYFNPRTREGCDVTA